MGYIRHEVVVGFIDYEQMLPYAQWRHTLSLEQRTFFPAPSKGINLHFCLTILPDGSKQGWGFSNKIEALRQYVIENFLEKSAYPQYVRFKFAGDDGETAVLFSTDDPPPERQIIEHDPSRPLKLTGSTARIAAAKAMAQRND